MKRVAKFSYRILVALIVAIGATISGAGTPQAALGSHGSCSNWFIGNPYVTYASNGSPHVQVYADVEQCWQEWVYLDMEIWMETSPGVWARVATSYTSGWEFVSGRPSTGVCSGMKRYYARIFYRYYSPYDPYGWYYGPTGTLTC